MAKIVTREKMMVELTSRTGRRLHEYVGRALVVLLNNQTREEQRDNQTQLHNDIGFTGADGRAGALSAKTFLKHGYFPHDWQLEQWLKPNTNGIPRIAKYHAQLDREAKRLWRLKQEKREAEERAAQPQQIHIPMHDEAAYKADRKAEEDASEARAHGCTAEQYRNLSRGH